MAILGDDVASAKRVRQPESSIETDEKAVGLLIEIHKIACFLHSWDC